MHQTPAEYNIVISFFICVKLFFFPFILRLFQFNNLEKK